MTDRAALQTMVIQANPVPDPVATAEHLDAYRSLLALIDQRSGAMDHHTEQTESPPDTPPPPKRSRAPVWAFALAFIVVLVAVGVAALVVVRDNDDEVVDEPITTTTLAALQSTTTPPTTDAVNSGEAEPVSFVPGLGTLTWTKVAEEDVKDARNKTVIFNPEFGYLRCFGFRRCGVSGDGLSWRPFEGPADHGNAVLVLGLGNTPPMALASPLFKAGGYWSSAENKAALHEEAAAVLAWEDGRWVEVGLLGPLPEAVDIRGVVALPRAPSGEYAFDIHLETELPWVELYGTFDDPTCESGECIASADRPGTASRTKAARAEWDAETDVLRIEQPFGGGVLARLKIAVSGNTATFEDVDTGDVAFELVGDATVPIGPIVEAIKASSWPFWSGHLRGVWTASFGSEFELHLPPLSQVRFIYAVPDGSGYVAYDRSTRRGLPRVWTSQDAIRWRGPSDLPFPPPESNAALIRSGSDVIYALVESPDGSSILEFWVSTDGVAWTQGATPPRDEDPIDHVQATEFGFVATATTDEKKTSGEWHTRARFWVSTDGYSWIEVAGPPGPHVTTTRGRPGGWAHGVGSNIYWGHSYGEYATLWVGRFEP